MINSMFICMTGDVILSKEVKNEKVLNSLPEILDGLNEKLSPLIRFQISAGDEFQGLLSIKQNPFDFIDYLEYRLFPIRFRIGIGIGRISTDIQDTTLSMRGPVFEFARKALRQAKSDNRYYAINSAANYNLLDDLLKLISFMKNQWSNEMVFRRYYLYRIYHSAQKVGELEGVSKVAVNKTIKKYGYREIIEITDDIQRALQEL